MFLASPFAPEQEALLIAAAVLVGHSCIAACRSAPKGLGAPYSRSISVTSLRVVTPIDRRSMMLYCNNCTLVSMIDAILSGLMKFSRPGIVKVTPITSNGLDR